MQAFVILISRLSYAGSLLKQTTGGKSYAIFSIACGRGYKNQDGSEAVDFIPVVVWGDKQPNTVAKHTCKGSLVAIDGRLEISIYEKDGQRIQRAQVNANSVKFLDNRKNGTNGNNGNGGGAGESIELPSDEEFPF